MRCGSFSSVCLLFRQIQRTARSCVQSFSWPSASGQALESQERQLAVEQDLLVTEFEVHHVEHGREKCLEVLAACGVGGHTGLECGAGLWNQAITVDARLLVVRLESDDVALH